MEVTCDRRWIFEDGRKHMKRHGGNVKRFPSEYRSYVGMVHRCYKCQPGEKDFGKYRAVGVVMCDRWIDGVDDKSGFECFLDDMGPKPTRGHTIDRYPNQSGNYEPSNCRWATRAQQVANRTVKKTSPFLGVAWHAITNKWRAKIQANGPVRHLGIYQHSLTAALAFDDAAFEARGRDAVLNFPERYR